MEPVFTLPYSEYGAANLLSQYFKRSHGYSIFVPASRQEKGVDLLLAKRSGSRTAIVTFQVKSSRTYSRPQPKRSNTAHFAYYTWFNRFRVAREADFYILFGLYPPEEGRTKKSAASWWSAMVLLFSREDMRRFVASVKTKGGKPDNMFGFGFNDPTAVFLTRGHRKLRTVDYTQHVLSNKLPEVRSRLQSRLRDS